jgi:hypothetical protein
MEETTQIPQDLLGAIVAGAEKYKDSPNLDALLDEASDSWYQINISLTGAHPTKQHTNEFLQDVLKTALKNTLKKLATSKQEITTVTLVYATQQLVDCLIQNYGWTVLAPYQIPLEILAAVFFAELLKQIAISKKDS